MIGSVPPLILIDLQRDDRCGRLTVSLSSYLRFADELSAGMDVLVDRWRHAAPPRALLGSAWRERDEAGQA